MQIVVTCKCGRRIEAPTRRAGKRVKCKSCGRVMQLPSQAKAPHTIFICYAREDKAVADAVRTELEVRGQRCFMAPRHINKVVGNWDQTINQAIIDSRIVVLLYSSFAGDTPQVQRELDFAMSRAVTVVPVRIENVPLPQSVTNLLPQDTWLEAFMPPLEEHIFELADIVVDLLNDDMPSQAVVDDNSGTVQQPPAHRGQPSPYNTQQSSSGNSPPFIPTTPPPRNAFPRPTQVQPLAFGAQQAQQAQAAPARISRNQSTEPTPAYGSWAARQPAAPARPSPPSYSPPPAPEPTRAVAAARTASQMRATGSPVAEPHPMSRATPAISPNAPMTAFPEPVQPAPLAAPVMPQQIGPIAPLPSRSATASISVQPHNPAVTATNVMTPAAVAPAATSFAPAPTPLAPPRAFPTSVPAQRVIRRPSSGIPTKQIVMVLGGFIAIGLIVGGLLFISKSLKRNAPATTATAEPQWQGSQPQAGTTPASTGSATSGATTAVATASAVPATTRSAQPADNSAEYQANSLVDVSEQPDRNPRTPVADNTPANPTPRAQTTAGGVGQVTQTFIGHSGLLTAATFWRDGRLLLTASDDHTLRLWRVENSTEIRPLRGHIAPVRSVAISPDGMTAVSGGDDRMIRIWNLATGRQIQTIQTPDKITYVSYMPDGKQVVVGSDDRRVHIWDLEQNLKRSSFNTMEAAPEAVHMAPSGRRIIAGEGVWDVTGSLLHRLRGHRRQIRAVAFSPDSLWGATGGADGDIRVWAIESGMDLRRFDGHTNGIRNLAFSPDGKFLISTANDATLRVWNVATGQQVSRIELNLVASALAVSPDGQFAITDGPNNTVRMWRIMPAPLVQVAAADADAIIVPAAAAAKAALGDQATAQGDAIDAYIQRTLDMFARGEVNEAYWSLAQAWVFGRRQQEILQAMSECPQSRTDTPLDPTNENDIAILNYIRPRVQAMELGTLERLHARAVINPEWEQVEVKMLLDEELVGNARAVIIVQGALKLACFTHRTPLTMEDIRARYGEPTAPPTVSETGVQYLTYGRFVFIKPINELNPTIARFNRQPPAR